MTETKKKGSRRVVRGGCRSHSASGQTVRLRRVGGLHENGFLSEVNITFPTFCALSAQVNDSMVDGLQEEDAKERNGSSATRGRRAHRGRGERG